MEDLLGQLGEEYEHENRELEVESNCELEQLIDAYHKVCQWPHNKEESYNFCEKCIPDQISARAIREFSFYLAELESPFRSTMQQGLFLSACINNCAEDHVSLWVSHLPLLDYLGYKNTKDVIIQGDVGYALGESMCSGRIRVQGNTGDDVGIYMQGGRICIAGNVEDCAGEKMKGGQLFIGGNAGKHPGVDMQEGEIVILGDAKTFVGMDMEGGVIRMQGDCASVGTLRGGTIYYKNWLLALNGEFTDKEWPKLKIYT